MPAFLILVSGEPIFHLIEGMRMPFIKVIEWCFNSFLMDYILIMYSMRTKASILTYRSFYVLTLPWMISNILSMYLGIIYPEFLTKVSNWNLYLDVLFHLTYYLLSVILVRIGEI